MQELRIAFLGDVVGRAGRRVLQQQIPHVRADHDPHFIVANGENARSGSGLSPENYRALREAGVDALTLGDHALREPKVFPLLEDRSIPVARPANISRLAPGKTSIRLDPAPGSTRSVIVLTVLGRIFFPLPADDPFDCVDRFLANLGEPAIVIVEAHMEATSEKIALARHLDGRVAAVVGSHTHVPTADARILSGGTAFITDVGMCGPYDSIIGRDADSVLRHMRTAMHVPYPVAIDGAKLCGAVLRIDERTGRAMSIERIEYDADYSKPPFV